MEDLMELLLPVGSAANKELADPTLLSFYNNLDERIIWIDEEISEETLSVVHYILMFNRLDKNIPVEQRKPIRLIFCSPGGSLDVEETLVSFIKMSKTPIYGIAIGCVASAASLIYLACHKRLATQNAYWVFHKGSCSNIGGNYNEVQAMMEDYKEQIEKMEKYYIEHTNFSEEMIKEKLKTDWYIHVDEALSNGVVDEVITDLEVLL